MLLRYFSFIFELLDTASYGEDALEEVTFKYLFMGKDLPKSKSKVAKVKSTLENYESPSSTLKKVDPQSKRGFGKPH